MGYISYSLIDIDPVGGDIAAINDNISLWHKRDFQNGNRVRSWSIRGNEQP